MLPRFEYSYMGQIDPLGGRLSLDTQNFNVLRDQGTNTQRASLTLNWEPPFTGMLGDLWKFTLHGDAAFYNATKLNEQPNFSTLASNTTARALPQVAVDFRWPFMRNSGDWGTQLIEPQVQLIVAPNAGNSQFNRSNEDSLDLEFTDANLFGFNRFPGIDRLEGGVEPTWPCTAHGSSTARFRRSGRAVLPHGEERELPDPVGPQRHGLRCRDAHDAGADGMAGPDLPHPAR